MRFSCCKHSNVQFLVSSNVGYNRCPACETTDVPNEVMSAHKHKRVRVDWVVDSGATVHCVSDRSILTSEYVDADAVYIKVADKRIIKAHAVGTAVVSMIDHNGYRHQVTLHNVVYHPQFGSNLLSVRRLWKDNRLTTRFEGKNYLKCKHTSARFYFKYDKQYKCHTVNAATKVLKPKVDADIIHSRYGHSSVRRIAKMYDRCKRMPTCDDLTKHDPSKCPACLAGASKRKPFPKRETNPYKYFGQKLSSDLCGPFPKSIDGYYYMLNIVDAYTSHLAVYFLRSKSSNEVKNALRQFLTDNQEYLPKDKKITWHTDNGREFVSSDLDAFCDEFAVRRSFSVPYAPPQNAHAERMWGIILRTVRVLLVESNVHESFWTYAAQHACMLHNVMPNTRLAGEMSPYQAKYKTLPHVGNIRVWGCLCHYHLPDHERDSKLAPRAVPAVHLGGDPHRNGYLVYVPYLNRIASAYHLTFQERKFLQFNDEGIVDMPNNIRPLRDTEPLYHHATPPDNDASETAHDETDEGVEKCDHPHCTLPKHSVDTPHSYEQRPTRNRGRNPHRSTRNEAMILDDVMHEVLKTDLNSIMNDVTTPNNYNEAIKGRYAERWKESMNHEITDLMKHGTWELVRRDKVPRSHRVAKSRWVYKVKLNKDGSIERFKSRFVVCGYSQVKGVDYTHSFSATMRATSMRILLSLAAGEKLKLEHFDVTSAFTQSDIDSEIYVEPARGFEVYDENGIPYVLKLKKALYGTKQASRMWQLKLRSHLISNMGFTNSANDPCIFIRRWDDGDVVIVGVYVDDLIVLHKGTKLKWFTDEFTGPKGFNAKHVGPLSWFLGMSVEQGSDYTVTCDQSQYIDKLIEKFVSPRESSVIKHGMPCNPITFQKLSTAQNDMERDKMDKLPYLQLIGSLLWLTLTRPDIYYYCTILCSFMHDPSPNCYYAALDLLLYISHTRHYKLHFPGSVKPLGGVDPKMHDNIRLSNGLVAYSDASWRKPNSLGYSMFGYVIYLFGAPITFAAKHLKIVAMSSAEAEYAAASYACKEVVFVRKILSDLGCNLKGPTVLCVDNQAAIKVAENVGVTARTKHFVDTLHYFRHLVEHRVVIPTFVRTQHQCADGFTKPLGKGPHREWCRRLIHVDE
jgi:transposase InsO family protein